MANPTINYDRFIEKAKEARDNYGDSLIDRLKALASRKDGCVGLDCDNGCPMYLIKSQPGSNASCNEAVSEIGYPHKNYANMSELVKSILNQFELEEMEYDS